MIAGFFYNTFCSEFQIMGTVLSCYSFYHMGVVIKNSKTNRGLSIGESLCNSIYRIFIISNYRTISLGADQYYDPVFLIFVSYLGWIFIYEISYFMEKEKRLKTIFNHLGSNTLPIVVLHFLCFKIVSYIGIVFESKPYCLIAAFPVLYKGGMWWIAYSFVGVTVPIGLNKLRKTLKSIGCFKNILTYNGDKN